MRDEVVETIEYRDCVIKIYTDDYASNPREEFDNLGHMICWHRNYDLGDKHKYDMPDRNELDSGFFYELACELDDTLSDRIYYITEHYKNPDERIKQAINRVICNNVVMLDLYLYDHGSITMNTKGFSCPWDSGQVGFIYVTKAEILKEYNCKYITKAIRNKVKDALRSEVNTYDQYLTGSVYGFVTETDSGDDIDSCWGFYGSSYDKNGSWDYMIDEAKGSIDWYLLNQIKVISNKLAMAM